MVELGVLYGTGSAWPDEPQAASCSSRAAEAAIRARLQSCRAFRRRRPRRRIRESKAALAKAAETNAEAQYQLGIDDGGRYRRSGGRLPPRRALFEKAAAQKSPGALDGMGAFAQSGRGGPKDSDARKRITKIRGARQSGRQEALSARAVPT